MHLGRCTLHLPLYISLSSSVHSKNTTQMTVTLSQSYHTLMHPPQRDQRLGAVITLAQVNKSRLKSLYYILRLPKKCEGHSALFYRLHLKNGAIITHRVRQKSPQTIWDCLEYNMLILTRINSTLWRLWLHPALWNFVSVLLGSYHYSSGKGSYDHL